MAVVFLCSVVFVVGGAHVELDVSRRQAASRADERHDLGHRRAQRPRAPQQPLGQVPRTVGPIQRAPVRDLPDHRHERVVLQVAAHARQLDARLHSRRAQLLRGADPRQQQQLRGVDRAGRQQDLARGAHQLFSASPLAQAYPHCAIAFELDTQHARARAHLEVGALQRRAQERVRGAHAGAVSLRHLEHRDAVLLGAVVVGDAGDPRRRAGLKQKRVERPRRALL